MYAGMGGKITETGEEDDSKIVQVESVTISATRKWKYDWSQWDWPVINPWDGSEDTGGGAGNGGNNTNPQTCQTCQKSLCECCTECKKYPCECEIEITISSSGRAMLGKQYSVTASVTPAGKEFNSLDFYIVSSVGEHHIGERTKAGSITALAMSPGEYRLKVIGRIGSTTYDSNEVDLSVVFPSGDEALAHFQTARSFAWLNTIAAANAQGVKEFGFSVNITTHRDTGTTYSIEAATGTFCSYEYLRNTEEGMIDFPINNNYGKDPTNGGTWTVAVFHTHPPLCMYTGSESVQRVVGPSSTDRGAHPNIPGVVQDFVGVRGVHSSKHSLNSPTMFYPYGPSARND